MSSPRCCRCLRSARVTTVRITSLTVPPSSFLIALTSSRSPRTQVKRRLVPTMPRVVGRARRGPQPGPGQRAGADGELERLLGHLPRAGAAARGRGGRSRRGWVARSTQRLGQQLQAAGRRLRAPSRRDSLGAALVVGGEQHGQDVHARRCRRPSRGGSSRGPRSGRRCSPSISHISQSGFSRFEVASRRRARPASSARPRCPGRGSAVERTWKQQVEVLVVDPLRPALAERDVRQPLAVARHHRQPRAARARRSRRSPAPRPRRSSRSRRASAGSRPPGGGTRRRAESVGRWPCASLLADRARSRPSAIPDRPAATLDPWPTEGRQDRRGVARPAVARAVRGAAREGDRAAVVGRVLRDPRARASTAARRASRSCSGRTPSSSPAAAGRASSSRSTTRPSTPSATCRSG